MQDYLDSVADSEAPVTLTALTNVPATMVGGDPHYGNRIAKGTTFEATLEQAERLVAVGYAEGGNASAE